MARRPNLCENLVVENRKRYARGEPTKKSDNANIPVEWGIVCPKCDSVRLQMVVEEHKAYWGYWNGYRVICRECDYDPVEELYGLYDEYPELEPPHERAAIETFLTGERK